MKNKFFFYFFILLFVFISGFLILRDSSFFFSSYFERDVSVHSEQYPFLSVDKIIDIESISNHRETPTSVRAIYMSSWVASSKRLRSRLISFIEKSRINSVVLDIKDYSGIISFQIDNELIDTYGTDGNRISDIGDLIDELHKKNIYIIGRITVFQDPLLAKVKPEFAFKRKDNQMIWKDKKGLAFINPQKEEAWEYYAVIAEESYNLGFDEINFDYIRYPSDGNIINLDYDLRGKTKLEVMKSFYEFLDKRLRKQEGIPISADLFGFTASRDGDLTIGQNLRDALLYFDAVAPMVYPSHYPSGYLGFLNPAEHPYEIVYHEMDMAKEKATSLGLESSSLRTWIQDFDLGAPYGINEIQKEIRASYDAGIFSYMVWDPNNRYTKNAYYDNLRQDEETKN